MRFSNPLLNKSRGGGVGEKKGRMSWNWNLFTVKNIINDTIIRSEKKFHSFFNLEFSGFALDFETMQGNLRSKLLNIAVS